MSKAVEQFNEWYDNRHVPMRIMNALVDEANAIDKGFVDNVMWEFRRGIVGEMELCMTLSIFIYEHEEFMEMINKKED